MGNGLHRQAGNEEPELRTYRVREVDPEPMVRYRRQNDERRPNGDGNNTAARWHARRQDIVFYRKDSYNMGDRTPRIDPSLGYVKFWESPLESKPYVEAKIYPIIWPHGLWREDEFVQEESPESFPNFITPYLNRDLRFYLKMDGTSNGPRTIEPYPEANYMFRNFRYLKVRFMDHPLSDGIRMSVEENHGTRRMRIPKFRPMYSHTIIPNHIEQMVYAIGEDFTIILKLPAPNEDASRFPDGNGEVPRMIGTYTRELDTNPSIVIEWKVALYQWYNQTEGYSFRESVS